MKNETLTLARIQKIDEFYTRYEDIEKELSHYKEQLKDKVIYCNCDDYRKSNFVKYFIDNFSELHLKKLIATHYIQQNIFDDINVYRYEKTKDNENITKLNGDGSFMSDECLEILQQADVVITNPPFSLFRQYMNVIMKYNKQFLVIGNLNAITYKEIFPLIKDNKIWFGITNFNNGMYFYIPKNFVYSNKYKFLKEIDGKGVNRVPGVCWFTNIQHEYRHKPFKLKTMEDNIKNGVIYNKYDNYDAIDVSVANDIPFDYNGVMGVPITFLNHYCPEQFEILGIAKRGEDYLRTKVYTENDCSNYNDLNAGPTININGNIKVLYARLLIKRK